MKFIYTGLLLILTSFAHAEGGPTNSSLPIDSLLELMVEENKVSIQLTELLGKWSKMERFSSSNITFAYGNLFSSAEVTCLGKVGKQKGTYTINVSSLGLKTKKQQKEVYLLNIDSQLYLLTENDIQETKQLLIDHLTHETLLKAEDMRLVIKKHLVNSGYRKNIG
ncbi:hypothetical protein Q0590_22580 [Rhodocytophaga aerolata]|uniref:DUF4468 domain-containing protein n=1 Tax=Rhodocytophaga aerolata TaxID=455078 RepID=A0ABT8REB9_9BACT|nr:hypothetical protein [Rhodocytophaga aerolata]MDO1449080.1 hypothetical protein [Rhodocytophaga aerolata]